MFPFVLFLAVGRKRWGPVWETGSRRGMRWRIRAEQKRIKEHLHHFSMIINILDQSLLQPCGEQWAVCLKFRLYWEHSNCPSAVTKSHLLPFSLISFSIIWAICYLTRARRCMCYCDKYASLGKEKRRLELCCCTKKKKFRLETK